MNDLIEVFERLNILLEWLILQLALFIEWAFGPYEIGF